MVGERGGQVGDAALEGGTPALWMVVSLCERGEEGGRKASSIGKWMRDERGHTCRGRYCRDIQRLQCCFYSGSSSSC